MIISSAIFCIFIGAFLHSCHYTKGGGKSSLTDKISSNSLKGIAAVLIVLSHAHYYTNQLGILKIFSPFGFIGVSLFFFCSGYGVMLQYIQNKNYLRGFLANRFKSVYKPYIVATIIWFIINILFFDKILCKKEVIRIFMKNILLIKMSLPFAWYVLAVLIWYLVFYIVAMILKKPKLILAWIIILNIIWYFIGISLGIPSFYYNGTCCITIGCIIAVEEKNIKTPKWYVDLINIVLLNMTIVALYLLGGKSSILYTIIIAIGSAVFILLLYTIGYKILFFSNITQILGRYSYEIYLVQGVAYLLAKMFSEKVNGMFWIIFMALMIILAYLEKQIIERI